MVLDPTSLCVQPLGHTTNLSKYKCCMLSPLLGLPVPKTLVVELASTVPEQCDLTLETLDLSDSATICTMPKLIICSQRTYWETTLQHPARNKANVA
jgi:hypothetical protein